MLKSTFCFLLTITALHATKAQDTLYFDEDWRETSNGKHAYYRPLPLKKEGELLLLRDYYKNGQLQMQGYIKASNPEIYVGDIYWYDENGFDTGMRQYKNKSSFKELSYYYPDGSLWQKITYSNTGEKEKIITYIDGQIVATGYISPSEIFSGTFSYGQPIKHYEYKETDEDSHPRTVANAPMLSENKKQESNFYFIIVFWDNGNKASETKVTYTSYGSTTEVYKKTWNKEGKLISERKYDLETPSPSYIEQEYYTKNYLATRIQETTPYKNGEKHGVSIVYNNNGDTLYRSIFKQDELQEVNIYQDNTPVQKNAYQNNNPYDGVFTEEMGGVTKEFNLRKGIKVGKEILKEKDSEKILAEGVYQNGQPWDGTFFNEGDLFEILQYKNGIQEGVQRAFSNLYFEHIKEEFEMKNGLRDGYRRIYDEDSLVNESVYENDQIVSGTIQEDNMKLTYANGKLKARSQFHHRDENRLLSTEQFEQDELQSITYFDFTIEEQPKASYTGYFKNHKPFSGFFKLDTLIDEIPLIDYYENGELKYQYSFDFIEQLENYDHFLYTERATYREGKIVSGPQYKNIEGERLLLRMDYRNERVNRFNVNFFAMHFFTRMTFELKNDVLSISAINSPVSIKVYRKNQSIVADLYKDGKLLRKGEEQLQVEEGSPSSITFYYIKDKQIKAFATSILPFLDENLEPNDLVMKLYPIFPMHETMNMQTLLNKLLSRFESDNIYEMFEYSMIENFPFKREDMLTTVEFDKEGEMTFGIRPSVQSDGSILVKGIDKGQIKKKTIFKNIDDLLKNNKANFKKFEHSLLNTLD